MMYSVLLPYMAVKSFKQKITVAWFWFFGICLPEIKNENESFNFKI